MSSLLEVSGVSVSFDGFKAINNLSFQIGAAELRAIIGPNGAGKTTFMDIVTGKTRPDTGVVKWGDKSVDLLSLDEAQIAQAGVGRKFQKPTVFEDQTVFENLLLALKNHRNVFRVLFYKRRKSDHQKVADLARDISLDSELHRLAGELSHGQKQWLEIGMAVSLKPRLLLLDEPTAGMSPEETHMTGEMVQRLNADGMTVLAIEHDMAFVRQVAHRVTVLHLGQVFAQGSIDEIVADERVAAIYLGQAHA